MTHVSKSAYIDDITTLEHLTNSDDTNVDLTAMNEDLEVQRNAGNEMESSICH